MFVGVAACLLAVVTAVPVQQVTNVIGGYPNILENAIPVGGTGMTSRIVGGTTAESNEFPWQVSLQYRSGTSWYHFCGGSLVAPNWILTAAHCLDGMGGYTLRVALGDHTLSTTSNNEQHITPTNLYIHGSYDGDGAGIPNDIGMVKLESDASYTSYVQPVDYASATDTFSSTDECFISGWGLESATGSTANTLKKSDMDVMTNQRCRRTWGASSILSSHICINDHDSDSSACMGDSGGPLVCVRDGSFLLAGLTSWGSSQCHTNYPNVYTRISSFRDWVDFVMANY